MNIQDFSFDLPQDRIAQYPLPQRTDSRLLVQSEEGAFLHQTFRDLPQFLRPGDLLILNNSRVIPARLFGCKDSGGKVELLLERVLNEESFLAHIRASKAPKAGTIIHLEKNYRIEVQGREGDLFLCQSLDSVWEMLEAIGHIPLPPYIRRQDEGADRERYQCVYAKPRGSVAAPTAGLHFDAQLLQILQAQGIELTYTTLHVGAGTFQPLRVENIDEHRMHAEYFVVDLALCEAVERCRKRGGRVIAVGTTALRSVESAARRGCLQACQGETDIFIRPGYRFQVFDGLITNFHLSQSTLLMLVSAFTGYAETRALYQEAIRQNYRFFSYGDASLLWRKD